MNTPKTNGLYTSNYFRTVAALAANTNESLVMSCTPREWLAVYDAYHASGWDITPDQWSAAQFNAAIEHGLVPAWDPETEQPLAPKKCAGFYVDANTGELTSCPECNPKCDKPVLAPIYSNPDYRHGEGWALLENDRDVLQVTYAGMNDSDERAYALAASSLTEAFGAVVSVRRWA